MPPFDILESGNLRKSSEAEAYYILYSIVGIMKNKVFKNKLKSLIKKYNFNDMISKSFLLLLKEWQSLQCHSLGCKVFDNS